MYASSSGFVRDLHHAHPTREKYSKIRDHMTSLTIQRDHNYWCRTSCTLWMQNRARYFPLFHPCWGQGEEWKTRQDVLGHVLSGMFRDHHQLTPTNQPNIQPWSHTAISIWSFIARLDRRIHLSAATHEPQANQPATNTTLFHTYLIAILLCFLFRTILLAGRWNVHSFAQVGWTPGQKKVYDSQRSKTWRCRHVSVGATTARPTFAKALFDVPHLRFHGPKLLRRTPKKSKRRNDEHSKAGYRLWRGATGTHSLDNLLTHCWHNCHPELNQRFFLKVAILRFYT